MILAVSVCEKCRRTETIIVTARGFVCPCAETDTHIEGTVEGMVLKLHKKMTSTSRIEDLSQQQQHQRGNSSSRFTVEPMYENRVEPNCRSRESDSGSQPHRESEPIRHGAGLPKILATFKQQRMIFESRGIDRFKSYADVPQRSCTQFLTLFPLSVGPLSRRPFLDEISGRHLACSC